MNYSGVGGLLLPCHAGEASAYPCESENAPYVVPFSKLTGCVYVCMCALVCTLGRMEVEWTMSQDKMDTGLSLWNAGSGATFLIKYRPKMPFARHKGCLSPVWYN